MLGNVQATRSRLHDSKGSQRRARASSLGHLYAPHPGYLHVRVSSSLPFHLTASLPDSSPNHPLHSSHISTSSIKLSPLPSHTPSQTLDNLLAAIPQVVSHIKGGWSNIQSLNIKTSTSVSLPIWQCDLGDAAGQRWDGMGEEQWEAANAEPDSESEAEEGGEKKQKKEEVKNGKGKKRSVEESSNEFTASAVVPSPAPSKKAKSPKSSSAAPSTSSPAPSKKSKTAAAAAPSAATPIPAAVKPTKKAGASAPAKEIERKKKSSASAANTAKAGVIGKKGGKKGGK
jgi:ribosome biogenesis protein UTP30